MELKGLQKVAILQIKSEKRRKIVILGEKMDN